MGFASIRLQQSINEPLQAVGFGNDDFGVFTLLAIFKLGFQNYCDAYDFHLYEDKNGIRETFRRYDEMMKKYNAVKPVVTTEIGLNSQGMARNVVAADMIQTTAVFFACGASANGS